MAAPYRLRIGAVRQDEAAVQRASRIRPRSWRDVRWCEAGRFL
eukprot:CAMPEP_0176229054 /NCGR_PEP_ID=MMETSP0121_2-20121125/23592_1 /TAXON_ID=160619 /ORGANISM="Kryptoperidinium foliaceum, Strain CCMP 1326" /LENGTH=42 /DNA_ID= /DNA_START= /DNA_END= /DNA_ORIENTATION=